MAQTITAKDIAEKIKKPGEKRQVAVDRLKNWTREGLLKPTGEKHPGKGRFPPIFPERSLRCAAVADVDRLHRRGRYRGW